MQYCVYLRKSRADLDAEARGEGETLARHERALIELAKRQKLNIVEIYREVVSGETIAARPVMQKLLAEVEQGVWSGVLVMEVERLARGDTVDQGIMAQTFKYSSTKIITPMKTYDPNNEFDEEYFEFGLFMSRREYKTINRRLQRGRLASVKEGKYVANQPPYGYVRKKIEHDKGYTLEPHPEEAEVIKMIFELYAYGEKQPDGTYKRFGSAMICRRLNDLRILAKKADAWVPASVRDILGNPVYNGKIRWNWRPKNKKMLDGEVRIERPRSSLADCIIVDGLHEAIIDDETWNLTQTLIAQNPPHPGPSQYPLKNPLSGIVYCGKCGRSMTRRPYSNGDLPTLMCPVTSCDNISSRLDIVEEHIIMALEKWLHDYKLNWGVNAEKKPKNTQIGVKSKALKKIDDELKNLEKQIESLHDLLEQGVYSTDKFLERSKLLSEKIKHTQQDRAALALELNIEENREEARKNIIPKVEKVLEVYAKTEDVKLKNDLLKDVLEKVVYRKSVNARWHASADDFEIELYPKMPRVKNAAYK